jgi:uncharacterized protein YcbK (DUF882 family)
MGLGEAFGKSDGGCVKESTRDSHHCVISRRSVLGGAVLLGAAMALPGRSLAALKADGSSKRSLVLHNLHTDEHLEVTYWARGAYRRDALAQIDWIMRDHRTNEVVAIDRGLIDLLYGLQGKLGGNRTFEVISGYRSPATNAMLASVSDAVARKSLHMEGKAVDINVAGVRLSALRGAATGLKAGGVGYYPKSGFVHVDVGRVRYW